MEGYTKLFGSLVASTIWRESKETKIVWITMLALKNQHGIVEASLPGLADLARVTIPECEGALKVLMSPDKYSRSKEFEGRRIEVAEDGWKVLNHEKYRSKMSKDDRREYLRVKKAESRQKQKRAQPLPGEHAFEKAVENGQESHADNIVDNSYSVDPEPEDPDL